MLKQRPEDFLVEEQPLYEPCGEGEHLFLYIEKDRITTEELIRRVARKFQVSRREVGYAGLKDKYAITRQHLSVRLPDPSGDAAGIAKLETMQRVKLLWAARHTNKLKRGHLAGNRFVIRIRDVEPTAVIRVKPILDQLVECGAPNYFGEQRFGHRNNSQTIGRLFLQHDDQALLDEMLGRGVEGEVDVLAEARVRYRRGDYAAALELWSKSFRHDRQALDALVKGASPEQAVRAIDKRQMEFMVCAFQSSVFNDVLRRRVVAGTFDRLLPGDLAFKHENRACFAVDEVTAAQENGEQGRIASFEVSPSGPMWAPDMTRAGGEVDAMESAALEATGVTLDQLVGRDGVHAPGSRRPLRIPIKDADLSGGVDEHGPYVKLSFELPRGSFATTVLAEVMKTPGSDAGDA